MQFIQTDLAEKLDVSFLKAIGGYMSMDLLIKGVYTYLTILRHRYISGRLTYTFRLSVYGWKVFLFYALFDMVDWLGKV